MIEKMEHFSNPNKFNCEHLSCCQIPAGIEITYAEGRKNIYCQKHAQEILEKNNRERLPTQEEVKRVLLLLEDNGLTVIHAIDAHSGIDLYGNEIMDILFPKK